MNNKVLAYRHSQEVDGRRIRQEEVEILDGRMEEGVTTYIVRTQDGIVCTAIFNIFTGTYYADDIYGVIDNDAQSKKGDMEM